MYVRMVRASGRRPRDVLGPGISPVTARDAPACLAFPAQAQDVFEAALSNPDPLLLWTAPERINANILYGAPPVNRRSPATGREVCLDQSGCVGTLTHREAT